MKKPATQKTNPADSRVSMLIELLDQPGALEMALHIFSRHGVNLTHIESRPARGKRFDFYVDCEGKRDDAEVELVIAELETSAEKLLVLDNRLVAHAGTAFNSAAGQRRELRVALAKAADKQV